MTPKKHKQRFGHVSWLVKEENLREFLRLTDVDERDNGWELVAALSAKAKGYHYLFFKRPV